jgi:hypothetical protein
MENKMDIDLHFPALITAGTRLWREDIFQSTDLDLILSFVALQSSSVGRYVPNLLRSLAS